MILHFTIAILNVTLPPNTSDVLQKGADYDVLPAPSILFAHFVDDDKDILADYEAMAAWRRELFRNGTGFFKEHGPNRILPWKAAAERGSVKGMILYAQCLQKGTGVDKNEKEAVTLFRKAAESGNTDAMIMLAECYQHASGVPTDYAEAFKWFRKAVELGNAEAMYCLGGCYYNGMGVPKNLTEGIKYIRMSADSKYAIGVYILGAAYLHGYQGVEEDIEKGIMLYQTAADLGCADAMCDLAKCYLDGTGVKKNPSERVKWLSRAAEAQHPPAMFYLGRCYYNGDGVERDQNKAFGLIRKSAEMGFPQAMKAVELLESRKDR